jgi:uncharacterized protein YjiS (DUF1127 family)
MMLGLMQMIVALLREWRRRGRGRAALGRMGLHDLRDLGLTPAEAAREAGKPFWRA